MLSVLTVITKNCCGFTEISFACCTSLTPYIAKQSRISQMFQGTAHWSCPLHCQGVALNESSSQGRAGDLGRELDHQSHEQNTPNIKISKIKTTWWVLHVFICFRFLFCWMRKPSNPLWFTYMEHKWFWPKCLEALQCEPELGGSAQDLLVDRYFLGK